MVRRGRNGLSLAVIILTLAVILQATLDYLQSKTQYSYLPKIQMILVVLIALLGLLSIYLSSK